MKDEDFKDLNNLSSSLDDGGQTQAGNHLQLDQLEDYHDGALSPDEEVLVQQHLAICRHCATRLLDWAAFCDPEQFETNLPSQVEIDAAWAEFKPKLQSLTQASQVVPSSRTPLWQRLGGWIFSPRPAYSLAAIAIVFSLALVFWIISLNREKQALIAQLNQGRSTYEQEQLAAQNALEAANEEIAKARHERDDALRREKEPTAQVDKPSQAAGEPLLDVETVNVNVDNQERGKADKVIELSSKTSSFIFRIPWYELDPPYDDYSILIKDRTNKPVLDRRGLHYESKQGFSPVLPRKLFSTGEYTFEVYGHIRGSKTLLQTGTASIKFNK